MPLRAALTAAAPPERPPVAQIKVEAEVEPPLLPPPTVLLARSMWQRLFGASGCSGRLGSATDARMTCPTCGGTEFEADENFVMYCPEC